MPPDPRASDLQAQLRELETQRREGLISDTTFTVRRNLLVNQAPAAARAISDLERSQGLRSQGAVIVRRSPLISQALPPVRQISDLEYGLRELETQRREGLISEIGFTVQRNLLLNQADRAARRRPRPMPVPFVPPPPVIVHQPGRSHWVLIVVVLIAAALAAGAAALNRASPGPAVQTSNPTAPAAGSTAATPQAGPRPTPGRGPGAPPPALRLGELGVSTAGLTASVLTYADHFASTVVLDHPPAGGFYAAVRVNVCNATDAAVMVAPADFVLVEPDDTQVDFTSGPAGGMQPRLTSPAIPAHKCVSGWVNYGVVGKPTRARYLPGPLDWVIP